MEWIHCPGLTGYNGELKWTMEQAVGRRGVFMILSPAALGKVGFHGYLNDVKIVERDNHEDAKLFCENSDESGSTDYGMGR